MRPHTAEELDQMVGHPPRQVPGTVTGLQHELAEAEAEIRRHHRDFTRIRNLLEYAELEQMTRQQALNGIRAVVG